MVLKVVAIYADYEMVEFVFDFDSQPIKSIEFMLEDYGGGRPIENIWFVVSDGKNEKIFDYRR